MLTDLFTFKRLNKFIESLEPIGYKYKLIRGFGPGIIILQKILK
jgi:hypothetical protein